MKVLVSWKEHLRKRVIADRKRVRKETLREVLDEINIRMDKGEGSEFDDGYETALHELYITTALMIGKVDRE